MKEKALGHVKALRKKIGELEAMAQTLQALAECCAGDDRPDCPILKDFEDGAEGPAKAPHRFGGLSDASS
ncbi:merR family transcriptional regulator [Asticcacaulis biprosthecium C19]|uniref:MerR family transcriptional regulator n=1 Tax=Asticcacaulis biprosthecium C19 TaxID=715226 RepID=F4QG61_9CAUL|nr:merR family transcriptional regulator [Asticcacaulis biprosthecium C19]